MINPWRHGWRAAFHCDANNPSDCRFMRLTPTPFPSEKKGKEMVWWMRRRKARRHFHSWNKISTTGWKFEPIPPFPRLWPRVVTVSLWFSWNLNGVSRTFADRATFSITLPPSHPPHTISTLPIKGGGIEPPPFFFFFFLFFSFLFAPPR